MTSVDSVRPRSMSSMKLPPSLKSQAWSIVRKPSFSKVAAIHTAHFSSAGV
jgi:hypothetical protein